MCFQLYYTVCMYCTSQTDDMYKRCNIKNNVCVFNHSMVVIISFIFTQKWNIPFRWTSCSVDCIIKSHNCCFYQNISDNIKVSCYLLCTPIFMHQPSASIILPISYMFQYFFLLSFFCVWVCARVARFILLPFSPFLFILCEFRHCLRLKW